MINQKKIIESLSEIKTTEEFDQSVLKATIYRKKKTNFFNYKLVKRITLILTILSTFIFTTALAKDFIYECIINVLPIAENSYRKTISILEPVKIKQNNNVSCDDIKTLSSLEKSLEIKLVFDSNKYNEKIEKCNVVTNDQGQVEEVNISVSEFYDFSLENKQIDKEYDENFTLEEYLVWQSKRKKIDLSISFMTDYASDKTKEKFKNIEIISGTATDNNLRGLQETETYFENINTKGYYFISPSRNVPLHKELVFVNNNILYIFSANNLVTIEELLEMIKEF